MAEVRVFDDDATVWFAVVLPNMKIVGGVKRFLEIGNLLVRWKHRFTIYTPEGESPNWFTFMGEVAPHSKLQHDRPQVLIIAEPTYEDWLRTSHAPVKIFYAVKEKRFIRSIYKAGEFNVLVNSGKLFRYLGAPADVIKAY